MKTTIKNTLATIALLSTFGTQAASIDSLFVQPAFDEGTQTELSVSQINEILPWAKNSKIFLEDLLVEIKDLGRDEAIDFMINGIQNAVLESAPKNTELLMRYSLNRGMKIVEILDRETSDKSVSAKNAKLRVLRESIKFALKYYQHDLAFLNAEASVVAPFAAYGVDYSEFLKSLNNSILDASAHFHIAITNIGLLQYDLYRDLKNKDLAPAIFKLNNTYKMYSNVEGLDDYNYIKKAQRLNKAYIQANASGRLAEIDEYYRELEIEKKLSAKEAKARRERREAQAYRASLLAQGKATLALKTSGLKLSLVHGVDFSNDVELYNVCFTKATKVKFDRSDKLILKFDFHETQEAFTSGWWTGASGICNKVVDMYNSATPLPKPVLGKKVKYSGSIEDHSLTIEATSPQEAKNKCIDEMMSSRILKADDLVVFRNNERAVELGTGGWWDTPVEMCNAFIYQAE